MKPLVPIYSDPQTCRQLIGYGRLLKCVCPGSIPPLWEVRMEDGRVQVWAVKQKEKKNG